MEEVPERMLELMGMSLHGFMGYVDGRAPRRGVERRRERLIEWGIEEEKRMEREKEMEEGRKMSKSKL